jgi:hypothetical protein
MIPYGKALLKREGFVQFLIGKLQTQVPGYKLVEADGFQFLIGKDIDFIMNIIVLQFLIGKIKTQVKSGSATEVGKFQFLLGKIQTPSCM